jgi:opacity protein-like surface antigen
MLKVMRLFTLVFLAAVCAAAQPFGFGVKVGAPLTDALNAANGNGTLTNNATRFTIGPMVELRLPLGVGVEADLLYKRVNGVYTQPGVSAGVTANSFEIPILLKYRFGFPIVKPYVEAGPSFRKFVNVNHLLSCLGTCAGSSIQFASDKSGPGVTFGAGVELKLLLIRIAPELRYTRWGSRAFDATSLGTDLLHASQNQAEFLVGISF